MKKVRIGVIGCGAIAQVHHLPNLKALQDEFEVPIVCDVSQGAAAYVSETFNIPRYVTDYRDLLASDVDAVLLCHSDPKTRVAIAAFNAGKHVFIEKPMCFSHSGGGCYRCCVSGIGQGWASRIYESSRSRV